MIKIPKQLQNPEFRFLRLQEKSKVPIIGFSWKNIPLEYNNILLTDHLERDGNYGVIGGYGNLCILDIDDKDIANQLKDTLNTFTIKTCGGTNHFYFRILNDVVENQVLSNSIGEVRANNYYVVGPNCYAIDEKKNHEGSYEILHNMPIREITKDDFLKLIEPYTLKRDTSHSGEIPLDQFSDGKNSTRSETEFGEVIRLIKQGKSKEEVFNHMNAFVKWTTAHPQYRELTYKNALAAVPIIPSTDFKVFKTNFWELYSNNKKGDAIELLVDYFLDLKNIYTIKDDIKTEIWYYENGIYLPNGFCEINEWCKEFFGKYYQLSLINKIKDSIIAKTYINQDSFFKNMYPHILPVNNGLFNLLTGQLDNFDKNKIFFSKLKTNYNPKSEITLIEKFLKDIMGEDKETYLTIQEFFGFCLYKEYNIQTAIMLLGHGSNGKSAILNLLGRMIGAENISSLSLDQMNVKGFSTSQLFGKMVNICGELKAKTLEDTDLFKQITGGELIGADRKFKSYIYFRNYAKLISSCNKLPKTKDLTDGFFRRWIILDFKNKFIPLEKYNQSSEEERIIKGLKVGETNILDKICTPEEMEGLLNWSYEGLKRLLKNKKFTCDEDIDIKRNKWLQKSSSFVEFATEFISKSDNEKDFVFKDDVSSQYNSWCELKEIDKKERESIQFQAKMINDLFNVSIGVRENKTGFGANQKRAYIGINMRGMLE